MVCTCAKAGQLLAAVRSLFFCQNNSDYYYCQESKNKSRSAFQTYQSVRSIEIVLLIRYFRWNLFDYLLPILYLLSLQMNSFQMNYLVVFTKKSMYRQGFHQISDHSGVLPKVLLVFEDLKFKVSEVCDQKWCFPDSAQLAVSVQPRQLTGQSQENTNFGQKLNVLKYQYSFRENATVI